MIQYAKPVIIFFLLFTALCFPQSASRNPKASPKSTPAAKPAEKSADSLFPAVVAKVNGEEIAGKDLERLIRDELNSIGNPEWKDLRSEYRTELALEKITALINSRLLLQEAKAKGAQAAEAEVQAEIQKAVKTFKNEEEMNAVLAQQGVSRASLEKGIKENLITNSYLETAITKKITITPDEVSNYYSKKSEEFHHPDIVKTSHILIKAAGNTPEQDADAKKRAEDLFARAKKGEDFAALAKQYSSDPSAANGGDAGYSSKEALQPDYAEAAFSLPVGGVQLVQTPYGYYIIQVTDMKKEGKFSLEDIKEQLTGILKNQKYQEELAKLIARLREKAEIDILVSAKDLQNP